VDFSEYGRGVALFNRAEFFQAHEVLEDIWRAAPAEEKKFLQGVVQVAVAFHHYSTGNFVGMRSVMERAMRNLSGHPQRIKLIELAPLLRSLTLWREAMDSGQPHPPLPCIELAPGFSRNLKLHHSGEGKHGT
jgi:predicted metal-dependent hydrolase